MCLTLCLQKQSIYDNDLDDCKTCPLNRPITDDGQSKSCATCKWYDPDNKTCKLTGLNAPKRFWCCHYNAPEGISYAPEVPLIKQPRGFVVVATDEELDIALADYRPDIKLALSSQPIEFDDTQTEQEILQLIQDSAFVEITTDDNDDANQAIDNDLFGVDDEIINMLDKDDANLAKAVAQSVSVQLDQVYNSDIFKASDAQEVFVLPVKINPRLLCKMIYREPASIYDAEECVRGLSDTEKAQAYENFAINYASNYDGAIQFDWKGRPIIWTETFAIPGVFGEESQAWNELVGKAGLERMLLQHGLDALESLFNHS